MGSAVFSIVDANKFISTIELKFNFLDPIYPKNGSLSFESSVLHTSDSIANVICKVY